MWSLVSLCLRAGFLSPALLTLPRRQELEVIIVQIQEVL
jgi:hypothetical protein